MDNKTERSHIKLLKRLGFYRFLRDAVTNPINVLICIFVGPPGWIFLIIGYTLPSRRIDQLLHVADECPEDEALKFVKAALSINPGHQEALKLKENIHSKKLRIKSFIPLSDWASISEETAIEKLLEIFNQSTQFIYSSIPDKGQAFSDGNFLEIALTNTKPIPEKFIHFVERTRYKEYTEEIEEQFTLDSEISPPRRGYTHWRIGK